MPVSLNVFIELLQRKWPVHVASKPQGSKVAAFSQVCLLDHESFSGLRPDVLYVASAEHQNRLAMIADTNPQLCICYAPDKEIPTSPSQNNGTTTVFVDAPSVALLMNEAVRCLVEIQGWTAKMEALVLKKSSMQELLDCSEDILGLPVAASGPFFDSFDFTSHLQSDDPFFSEIVATRALSPQSIDKLKELSVFGTHSEDRHVKVFPPNKTIRKWHMNRHFREQGERTFFVTAMCGDEKPSPGTIELFDVLSQKLNELRRNQEKGAGSTAKVQELALKRLITEDALSREMISSMLDKSGIGTDGVWQLAVVQFGDPALVPKTYRSNLFRERYRDTLTCVLDNQIIALSKSNLFDSKMLSELTALAEENDGHIGVSSQIADIADAPSAYKQALFALRMGRRVSKEKILKRFLGIEKPYPESCFHFDDYLFHELFDHYPLGAKGLNPGRRPALALAEYDRCNNTQKTKLLHTYYENDCSVSKTAQVLGVHRNSVTYQIKSIEALLGVDVHSVDFICHTRLAFASMEVFGL